MLSLITQLAPAIAIVIFFVYIAVVMTKFVLKFDHRLEAVETRVSHLEKDLATVKETVNQILALVSSQKT